MRSQRRLTAAALVLGGAALLWARPASAHSGGQTGRSGKQGAGCELCHGGGALPEVRFLGPDQLGLGAVGTYRFEVRSAAAAQVAAGFDVAASAGRLDVLPDQDAFRAGSELTHIEPKPTSDGVAAWDFTWTAPAAPGTYTLFGGGNSVDLNGASTGDGARTARFAVLVGDAPPTPTETALPTPTATAVPACPGDCDGSRRVTINELVLAVAIALGSADPSACVAVDRNGDRRVIVDEIIAAVRAATAGC